MKTITIPVTDELHAIYLEKKEEMEAVLKNALEEKFSTELSQREEYVRVIWRAKAPVCNWHDMELQIMKGAL